MIAMWNWNPFHQQYHRIQKA